MTNQERKVDGVRVETLTEKKKRAGYTNAQLTEIRFSRNSAADSIVAQFYSSFNRFLGSTLILNFKKGKLK